MVTCRVSQGLGIGRREVGKRVSLEVPPKHLDRIDIRSVGREEIPLQLAVALEEPVDDFCFMGPRAVPNDEQRLLELRAQIAQELNHPAGCEVGVREQGKVKSYPHPARRDCNRRDGGDLLVPSSTVQKNRRPPARSPRPADQGCHHEAALVDKDDIGVQAAGFFLMRGQSSLIHFCTAFSSRSRARFSGFCGLQPIERSNRPI